MRKALIAAAIGVIALSGCGTAKNLNVDPDVDPPKPYGGLAADFRSANESLHGWPEGGHGWFPGLAVAACTYHGAIYCAYLADLPLSAIADTVTLPWTTSPESEKRFADAVHLSETVEASCMPANLPGEEHWPAGVVKADLRQDCCKAKVGQAVQFAIGSGYTTPTTPSLHNLKVAIDGVEVAQPEIFTGSATPGYHEQVYVFCPAQPGTYRVRLTPVYSLTPSARMDGCPQTWRVEMSQ